MNDHMFCCTLGDYDRQKHEAIVNGLITNYGFYHPNSKYTAYCTLNTHKFLDAMVQASRSLPNAASSQPSLIVGRVVYGDVGSKEVRYHGVPPRNYDYYTEDYLNHHMSAGFVKPPLFSPENELRIIAPQHQFGRTPLDAEALFFQSDALRTSILDIGHL